MIATNEYSNIVGAKIRERAMVIRYFMRERRCRTSELTRRRNQSILRRTKLVAKHAPAARVQRFVGHRRETKASLRRWLYPAQAKTSLTKNAFAPEVAIDLLVRPTGAVTARAIRSIDRSLRN